MTELMSALSEKKQRLLELYLKEKRADPRVVPAQQGGKGLPLYFIGAGLTESRIAQAIGEDRTIFAIDLPIPVEWRNATTAAALPTIEQLGVLYGDVLRAHVGSSPCVVAGYCFWAKVAFEAARALQGAGGNVVFVLLIDAFTWSGFTLGALWRSFEWIRRGGPTATPGKAPYIERLIASVVNYWGLLKWLLARIPPVVKGHVMSRVVSESTGFLDKEGTPMELAVMRRVSHITGKIFHPHPLDARGVLIRATYPGEEMLPGLDFTNGWGSLFARGLETVQAAGDHNSMVADEANRAALARQINAVLDRYGSGEERSTAACFGRED
jgi:Thioesterase domain